MLKAEAIKFVKEEVATLWLEWGDLKKDGSRNVTANTIETYAEEIMPFTYDIAVRAVKAAFKISKTKSPNLKDILDFAYEFRKEEHVKNRKSNDGPVEPTWFCICTAHKDWRKIGQVSPVYVEPLHVKQDDEILKRAAYNLRDLMEQCLGGKKIGQKDGRNPMDVVVEVHQSTWPQIRVIARELIRNAYVEFQAQNMAKGMLAEVKDKGETTCFTQKSLTGYICDKVATEPEATSPIPMPTPAAIESEGSGALFLTDEEIEQFNEADGIVAGSPDDDDCPF